MKIRMLSTAAGPDRTLIEGREYTLDDAEAAGLVEGNYAEQVPEPAPAEEEPQAAPPEQEPADEGGGNQGADESDAEEGKESADEGADEGE